VNLGEGRVERLEFERPEGTPEEKSEAGPRCAGVRLSDGTTVPVEPGASVVSGMGVQRTFFQLVEDKLSATVKPPEGLLAVTGRRPLLKVSFALRGGRAALDLPAADFWQLPSCSPPSDSMEGGAVKLGEIGAQEQPVKFTPGASWMHVDFQSTKVSSASSVCRGLPSPQLRRPPRLPRRPLRDLTLTPLQDPSFETRFGKDKSTCVVTIEADDDFVIKPPSNEIPKTFRVNSAAGQKQKDDLVKKVEEAVVANFPSVKGAIVKSAISPLIWPGLSHDPNRFAARCVRPSTPFPNLFLGGTDLTLDSSNGALSSAVLTANAMLGYSAVDIFLLGKSVATDLARFAEQARGEGCVAVKFDDGEGAEEGEVVS
jgi:hypothetical protein